MRPRSHHRPTANPIKITTDPDRALGKPMTLRTRNVMLRIFLRQVPEFRYNPDLGFALDVPDPGLLSIDGPRHTSPSARSRGRSWRPAWCRRR